MRSFSRSNSFHATTLYSKLLCSSYFNVSSVTVCYATTHIHIHVLNVLCQSFRHLRKLDVKIVYDGAVVLRFILQ